MSVMENVYDQWILLCEDYRRMEEDPQRAQSKCDRALVWIIWFPFPLLVLSLVACAGAWLASILAVFLFSWVTTVAALFFRLLVYASCIFFVVAVVLRVTSLAYEGFREVLFGPEGSSPRGTSPTEAAAEPEQSRRLLEPRASRPHQAANECAVCMTEAASHAMDPCGHLCVCKICHDTLFEAPSIRCPICRASVTKSIRIHAA
ncbi:hypothetical protein T484DRAFT_1890985 [Baffinella frigidus]|nr:hypothetical protein T484DRAFT_1890985 [Cryptophyta sp. CCMP2293]